jgi:hypothetical protein
MWLFYSLSAFSFQDTTRVRRNSFNEKTVELIPNVSGQKVISLGNYVAVVDDSTTFQLSYGLSVYNTIRGKVPNTGISPYAPFATVRQNSALVIDGLTYDQASTNFYNMNAFDYRKLIVLSHGNASSLYGLEAAGGAFVLQSKTGEGQHKPTIEYNSSLTSGSMSSLSKSYFSNAIAYMQDFGKIDTRISYNYLVMPLSDDKSHNIKMNTGFTLNSKFNARLIIDNLNNRSSSSSKSFYSIATDSIYNEMDSVYYFVYDSLIVNSEQSRSNRQFTQGNLMLRYQPFPWLSLSSQGSLGKFSESTQTIRNATRSFKDSDQSRTLANVFATIKPDLGPSFSLSSTFGFQHVSSDFETVSNFGYHYTSYEDHYYLSSLDFGFRDFLFTNYTLRKDLQSSIPNAVEKPVHSFSVAFVFTEAFGWKTSLLSNGKIRASAGRTFVEQDISAWTLRRPEQLLEVGTDLFFANNRASFTVNYFSGRKKSFTTGYDPSAGYWQSISFDESSNSGIELILDALAVKAKKFHYQTTLTWTKLRGELHEDYYQSGIASYALMTPSWSGTFLNTITFKNLLVNCLMVARADDFQQFGSRADRNTQIKLRDVSVGYDFSMIGSKIGLSQAHIYLTNRNSWLMYSKSGKDVETYFMHEPPKSTSLNLYLVF